MDNDTSFAYCPISNGYQAAEQFVVYRPSSLTDKTPIQVGQTLILKSAQTSKFCRIKQRTTTRQGMICDQAASSGASVLTFNLTGFSYNGSALMADGPGWFLYLNASQSTNLQLLGAPPMVPTAPPSACISSITPGIRYRLQDPSVGLQWCK